MKKGLSLLSLMITVIIIILLATTVTISATSSINNSRKISFATEISFIQESVNNYYTQNDTIPVLEKIYFHFDEKYKYEFNDEKVVDNTVELYKLDLSKIGNIETTYGKNAREDDVYAVSLDTNKIYYVAGLSIGNNIYYSLTDDLKEIIRYNDSSLNDGIIFNKLINKWTNQNINVEVLIPNKYTYVEVSIEQDGNILLNIYDYTIIKNYNKFVVDKIYGNYNIKVKYLKNGEEKITKFEVNNFDDSVPTYKLSNKKTFDNGKEKYSYIELIEVSDNLSGIAKLKYSKTSMQKDDIKNKGIDIQNNIMEFDENTEFITLYIEDKAGNYVYEIIDVRGE